MTSNIYRGSSELKLTTFDNEYLIELPMLKKTVLNELIIQPYTNIEYVKIDNRSYALENGIANIDKINYHQLALVYKETCLKECDYQIWCEGSDITCQECLWNYDQVPDKKYKRYWVIIPSVTANFYVET
jgi:hypothetical protein